MHTFLGIDYATWWFLVIGAVFTGYAILDGFDLGAGALHLFFKKEESRRIALNAIGPVWDGNEVWLVIGGGALFAGFPIVYATAFSAFYELFMLFLILLILRAISIEFRSKEPMLWWRKMWDITYSFSSGLLALALGLVVGNVVSGIAIDGNYKFLGTVKDFFHPFAILISLTTLALFMMHGAIYLVMKTENRLHTRLTILTKNSTIFFVIMYSLSTISALLYMPHMAEKYKEHPAMFLIPVISVFAIANITRSIAKHKYMTAFLSSAVVISMLMLMLAIGLFPNIVISTINENYNLTVSNASSTDKSLGIMLTFVVIGAPLVLAYTSFVFYTFRGKVKLDEQSY